MNIQRTTNKFIIKKMLVNPLMTNGYFQILFHPTAYLFWTPFFVKQLFNISPSAPVDTRTNFSLVSLFCKFIGLFRSITPTTAIPLKFSAYSRFMNTNYVCNFQLCKSYFKQRINSASSKTRH
jgi:hypothetical protein